MRRRLGNVVPVDDEVPEAIRSELNPSVPVGTFGTLEVVLKDGDERGSKPRPPHANSGKIS